MHERGRENELGGQKGRQPADEASRKPGPAPAGEPNRFLWLARLRWVAAAGLACASLAARFAAGVPLAWPMLVGLAAFMAACNGFFLWGVPTLAVKRREGPSAEAAERRAFLQIALDILVLVLALHFSGGVENPLAMLLILPAVAASVLLPLKRAFILAAWTSLGFAAMAGSHALWPSLHRPIPGHPPMPLFKDPYFAVG